MDDDSQMRGWLALFGRDFLSAVEQADDMIVVRIAFRLVFDRTKIVIPNVLADTLGPQKFTRGL